ncbi:ABC transporter permease [Aeromicrobium sp. Leaf350]|uniref:ABC transporter permease n=1 Tax=Aeromicrobium sp. Leaf350 TaxID=2876565 RepID=UPI001E4324CE|nr:ABC transporter permease [Aeromicrobium sp. Leaf350]
MPEETETVQIDGWHSDPAESPDTLDRGVGITRRPARWSVGSLRLSSLAGLYVLIALLVLFTLSDERFAAPQNYRVILASQAIAGILTLGLVVSLISGVFDVSIAATMALSISLVGWLQAEMGFHPLVAVVLTLLAGATVGALNAVSVTVLRVEPIIATLGSSAILAAVAYWIAEGQTFIDGISPGFISFGQSQFLSIPLPVYYLAAIALLLWFAIEHTPWGRYLRAIGANAEASRLAGIRVVRVQWSALIVSGLLASLAGIVLTMQLGAASFGAGDPYLLPAFAAAFLGSTQVQPGRFNVFGTLIALYLLATAVKGLQLRYPDLPWIADLIQGVTLIASVAIAAYAGRRRAEKG